MSNPNTPRIPEILAPAGSEECLRAAVENGADAVYFGLKSFSARARAENFDENALSRSMELLRQRGVKGYVALNTLAFDVELAAVERAIRDCARAGVDALIVQDLGVARLARAIAPELPLHASTQMTLTSAEGAELARSFGISRVIVARELSVSEIATICQHTSLEIEVFVHGALCVAYSGQCLTSEAWGGRSANRGECAQACRQPYTMFSDGSPVDTRGREYLLSPQDLQAAPLVPDLIRAGVRSLKIEGRLKTPEYVANATAYYRRAVERALSSQETLSSDEMRELAQPFSRGASLGFLGGVNHQVLVDGYSPGNRGVLLGRVEKKQGRSVWTRLEAPVSPGDGLMFEGSDYEKGFQGGRVFGVFGGAVPGQGAPGERVELRFGDPGPDLRQVSPNCRVFKTDDPALSRRLRDSFAHKTPRRRARLSFWVEGDVGTPLSITARDEQGHEARALSRMPLLRAEKRALTAEVAREQLGRLGEVPYELESVHLALPEGLIVPLSELNHLRRELVAAIDEARRTHPGYAQAPGEVSASLLEAVREGRAAPSTEAPVLSAVCRDKAQVEAALDAGADVVVIDFQDFVGARRALESARGKGATIAVATPRIQKPDEIPLHRNIAAWNPDAILVRSLGALRYYRELDPRPTLWGDFSLNAANSLTAEVLLGLGLSVLVPSYDLDRAQLLALAAVHGSRLEVAVHQHIPLFHMEHCVFAAFLSEGKDFRDCGRPCEKHSVTLKDPIGERHPVVADVGCRNTVFSGKAQSAAAVIPALRESGVRRFRLELAHEDAAETARLVKTYRAVLRGERDGASLWKELKVKNQVGTCHGTLYVL
jgi:putative protease